MADKPIPEMVERVARAMKASDLDCCDWAVETLAELAEIAIRAMREANHGMIKIGDDWHGDPPAAQKFWRVMIDAALGE